MNDNAKGEEGKVIGITTQLFTVNDTGEVLMIATFRENDQPVMEWKLRAVDALMFAGHLTREAEKCFRAMAGETVE